MKRLIIFLFLVFGFCNAQEKFDVNDKVANFSLPDQFNKIHTVTNDVKTIIVSFEKGTGKMVNQFLESKTPDFLSSHHAVFIANISGMPSIITKLFALPKMQDYKHTILLIYDDNDKRFLQKEEASTIYKLENGIVKSVGYVNDKEGLEKIF